MGGGRLPRSKALTWYVLAAAFLLSFAAGACFFGGDDDEGPSPTAVAPTASPTGPPPATPTPDRLATPPADRTEAIGWLQAALGGTNFDPPCPESIVQRGVRCAEGDADGDRRTDFAYLVPLKPPVTQAPYPAAVVVRRAASGLLEERGSGADVSIIGASVFAMSDRTGDGRGDVTFLENVCSATGCKTRAVVLTWDGNAWRDAGPGGEPIGNVDSVKWEGVGASSRLLIHGGKLPDDVLREAGPTRSTTRTFVFNVARYTLNTEEPDPPEYLYHAIIDADRLFDEDKRAAIEAFQAAADNDGLKDWRPPGAPEKDRRPALQGFALFRIALAHAALQGEPQELTLALDHVVNHGVDSGEMLFVNVATEFRRGYANGGLATGCAAVLDYINKRSPGTDTRGYIAALFAYGYENPPGSTWADKICPF